MDLRAKRTRNLLFEAFKELIEKKDYDDISVSNLCNKSQIRRATFYRHFNNKDDFFSAYITEVRDKVSKKITRNIETGMSICEYCQKMTEQFAELIVENQAMMRRQKIGGTFDRLLGIAMEQIAKDFNLYIEKLTNSAINEGLSAFYIGGLFGLLRHHLAVDIPFNKDNFLNEHRYITEMLFKDL